MTGYLQQLADLMVPAFVVSTMLAAGMSQPLADVVAPLRKPLPIVLRCWSTSPLRRWWPSY
jgi:hypothetical protein